MNGLIESGDIWIEEEFVPNSQALFSQLVSSVTWDDSMRARHAASFGVPYNYSGVVWPETPFPVELRPMLERLYERLRYRPNNCLANYYPDGYATMGFHADATDDLEPGSGIAVVSLGAARAITFRRKSDKQCLERHLLPSGSLLYMSPEMQMEWRHGILPEEEFSGGRISLTFRCMRIT